MKYPVRLNQLEALARSDQRHRFTRGIDGGVSCAACSVLLGMAVQLGADTRHLYHSCANTWKWCNILPVKSVTLNEDTTTDCIYDIDQNFLLSMF